MYPNYELFCQCVEHHTILGTEASGPLLSETSQPMAVRKWRSKSVILKARCPIDSARMQTCSLVESSMNHNRLKITGHHSIPIRVELMWNKRILSCKVCSLRRVGRIFGLGPAQDSEIT
jgi:hypothetical protein